MLFSSSLLQQCFFAVFLLCSPVPYAGRPVDTSSRMRRSVSETQLMHDKGRMLHGFRRIVYLQDLLDALHTGDALSVRSAGVGGSGLPGPSLGVNPSTTGSTLQSKPPGGTKNLPITFQVEEEEGTNLPQETNKSQPYKDSTQKLPGKRKRKGKSGRRKEGEKRKRTVRSIWRRLEEEAGSGLHLEWRSLLGVQRALQ
ncbi:parathyroid hormone-like hormone a [Cyprinodon tularosa]|uniref:Parathyroid hormone-like hormone a n=1 Tax=Cyprinodon variegatus TaxID=28743 RepID=A0A3Q2DFW4_CYPVA|nr:PREDICTED: parathyroid hormone-related protein-like [Cyprinodon variegatus]XP_015243207.1 PREDICTED: parathyroid hormone-related protein-like [Cyprinodon variegatus]XP_015243208.1 PREDICTED: parathyroid hormone-related protein-like [Cyprinodon variegatus]XP_038152079.1 parathyroid hormone-like hormone a [Cyprinodon tularosa]XP_038152080.1 parathyroid hormone-like hormone a [Cyprinodon tularosa]XP_038152081.1 parathyroid hormone-like hormone a [Cyprinodon tularosa]